MAIEVGMSVLVSQFEYLADRPLQERLTHDQADSVGKGAEPGRRGEKVAACRICLTSPVPACAVLRAASRLQHRVGI